MSLAYDIVPVTLVTGFLGSGKSTLLADLLKGDAARDTAVLVNEFGEVGLDHLLVGAIDAQTVLLDNGCLCCALRGELKDALTALFSRRARGELPPFSRVVLETSGLATPAPIVATLLGDPVVRNHYALAGVLTVVDALNHAWQRAQYPEWLAQVSAADRLLIGKVDLVDEARIDTLTHTLAALNPAADIVVRHARMNADAIGATHDIDAIDKLRARLFAPADVRDMIQNLGRAARALPSPSTRTPTRALDPFDPFDPRAHRAGLAASRVASFCLTFDAPLDWAVFTLWFTMLLNRHGEHILRVKGWLWLTGSRQPAILHAIRHLVYPVRHPDPAHDEIPADERLSRLVFIVEGEVLSADALRASYQRFLHCLEDSSH